MNSMIQAEVAGDARLHRRIDRAVFAEPGPVALLQPQRHQRAHAEQPQPVRLPGGHDPVEQDGLVFRRDPQLVAEIAGVVDAPQVDRDHAHVDMPERHERERLRREVEVGRHRRQHVPRPRTSHGHAGQAQAEDLERDAAIGRQVVAEPARVMDLGRQRSEEVEHLGVGRAGDRELADDPALVVEHRRQRDPPDARHARRQQRREPGLGARSGDAVLGVVRDLGHAHALAHRGDLAGDLLPGVRAAERDVLARLLAGRLEPERVLQPERRSPDGVGSRQSVVDRRRQQRPGGGQLLVGEGDPESPAVVLLDLGVRVAERGVIAVAGDIHGPDVHAAVAVVTGRHPGRQGETDAAALRQAGHHATGHPEAAQATDGADQGVAVGRKGEGAVDDLLDADRAHRRVVREGDLQLGSDALQVGRQEL